MKQEIAKIQKLILMRNGSEFWVTEDTADKIDAQLIEQTGHKFIKITELNRTINTADVSEIMTAQQVDDRNRLKRKEWQCLEKVWHEKNHKCECRERKIRDIRIREEQEERDRNNIPPTPAEEKKIKKILAETRKILEYKGILTKKMTNI